MTDREYLIMFEDRRKADKIFKQQLKGEMLDINLAPVYRAINKRKFDAELYDIPYVSVWADVLDDSIQTVELD